MSLAYWLEEGPAEPVEEGTIQFGPGKGLPKLVFNGLDGSRNRVRKIAALDPPRKKIILIQPGDKALYFVRVKGGGHSRLSLPVRARTTGPDTGGCRHSSDRECRSPKRVLAWAAHTGGCVQRRSVAPRCGKRPGSHLGYLRHRPDYHHVEPRVGWARHRPGGLREASRSSLRNSLPQYSASRRMADMGTGWAAHRINPYIAP